MTRLLNNLLDTLIKKIRLYDEFITLLQEEWDVMTRYSLGAVESMTAKKEKMVDKIQAMEKVRTGLMQSIAGKLKIPQVGLTLKKVAQSGREPIHKKLALARKKLLDRISKITQLNRQVNSLTEYASLSLKKSMAYIHSMDEEVASPYRSNGRLMDGKMESRMVSMEV